MASDGGEEALPNPESDGTNPELVARLLPPVFDPNGKVTLHKHVSDYVAASTHPGPLGEGVSEC
jgi:hypothetical protein